MSSDNRNKVYKGMSVQTVITITLGLLGITYFSIMSRLLSKEDFGYFAIITAVTSVLSSLSEAGLGSAVIQHKEADSEYIQTAWSLSFILGMFFCVVLFCSSGLISSLMLNSYVLTAGFQIMSFSLIFYAINSVGRAVIIKKLNFFKYGVYDIIAYTLSALIGVILAYQSMGFYAVIVAMLLHQVFLGILVLFANKHLVAIKIKKKYIGQIVGYGGWLTGSVIVRNITSEADKLITTHWIPVSILGAYNRPVGLIEQITGNINGIFDTILFPILSGINDDMNKVNTAYIKSVSLMVLFSLIVTGLFILGSDFIILIFLGKEWLYLTDIFQIVSLMIVFLGYDKIADCFFRSLGIVKHYFFVRCCIMVLTCICMFIGCQYGIVGLAIGLVASKVFSDLVKIIFLSFKISINRIILYKTIIQSCFLPSVLLVFCFVLKNILPNGFVIALLFYCMSVLLLAVFKPYLLGRVFYEDVYTVVRKRLIRN